MAFGQYKRLEGFVLFLVAAACFFLFFYLGQRLQIIGELNPTGLYLNKRFDCISYNPYRLQTYPPKPKQEVHPDQLHDDLKKISEFSHCIRLYGSLGAYKQAVYLAKNYKLQVIAGAFLSSKKKRNQQELSSLVELAKLDHVTHIIVSNENLLHLKNRDRYMQLSYHDLVESLRWVRSRVDKPISYGDVPGIWRQRRDLFHEVDFITAHFLPYWKEVPKRKVLDWVKSEYKQLKSLTRKPIFIGEIGWPTRGPTYGEAKATPSAQADFLTYFANEIRRMNLVQLMKNPSFNVIEAFDQPWKSMSREGRVASHWGLFNASGDVKKFMRDTVPKPRYFTFVIFLLVILLYSQIYMFSTRMFRFSKMRTLLWFSVSLLTVLCVSGLTIIGATNDYLLAWGSAISLLALSLINAMVFIETIMTARIIEKPDPKEANNSEGPLTLNEKPFISIQVPCANEPATQVISTIRSLTNLNYDNYEVLVLINNTHDDHLIEPVRQFCETCAANIQFINLGEVEGFKSGVLNKALELMSPKTDLVAVLDSDYTIDANWLTNVVPFFQRPEVAVVQCPQDYRDAGESVFKSMMYDELRGFFDIGMVERAYDNAIVQHGTMLVIRAPLISELGSWSMCSICEDAELGLRILKDGHQLAYLNRSLGQGLLPSTHLAYAKQRFRWVYGGLRIVFENWRDFMPKSTLLTRRQKFHFFWGWLPWIAEATYVPFYIISLFIGFGIINLPKMIPSPIYTLPLLLYVSHRILTIFINYRLRVKLSVKRVLLCLVSGLSLTSIVSLASLAAIFKVKTRFTSTEKGRNSAVKSEKMKLRTVFWKVYGFGGDILLGLMMLWLAMKVLSITQYSVDGIFWAAYLLVFAAPGLASLVIYSFQVIAYINSRRRFIKTSTITSGSI